MGRRPPGPRAGPAWLIDIEESEIVVRLSRRLALGLALLTMTVPAMAAEGPLRVGTSAGPYAEILDHVVPLAKAQGLDIKVFEFTDYTIPNEAMYRGDLDVSNFQHRPYLENANRTRGYDIVPLATSIITPLGIYSQNLQKIGDLPDGAQVAIPNDPSNGARALLLFQSAGLITLRPGADVSATVADITANPKHLKFLELDAAQLPRSLGDVAAAAVNMNYAVSAGLDPKKALVLEGKDSRFALVFTTRAKDKDNPRVAKLIAVYRSPEVKQFILDRFGGTIIPTW
jgi:D-methionine transport system substrate-binding protein